MPTAPTRSSLLTALLIFGVGCVDPEHAMDPSDPTEIVFDVPKGSSAKGIASGLVEQGLVSSEFQWTWFVRNEDASCLKAGPHAVTKAMTMREILAALCSAPIPDDIPFTVLEGWRIRDIDAALAEKGWIEPGAYQALADSKAVELPFEITSPNLEGYLYPETYKVPARNFDPKRFIERQLQTFEARFLAEYSEKLGKRNLHEIVVMASMLEREEPKPTQRPIVAGILWKRIDSGWQLGVDATSRYPLDDWTDEKTFRKKLKDPSDPYNTRIHKGLPPTAIGSPTLSALEAAVNPKASDFWFYLHDSTGVFHGGVDAAHHERNRAKYNVY